MIRGIQRHVGTTTSTPIPTNNDTNCSYHLSFSTLLILVYFLGSLSYSRRLVKSILQSPQLFGFNNEGTRYYLKAPAILSVTFSILMKFDYALGYVMVKSKVVEGMRWEYFVLYTSVSPLSKDRCVCKSLV